MAKITEMAIREMISKKSPGDEDLDILAATWNPDLLRLIMFGLVAMLSFKYCIIIQSKTQLKIFVITRKLECSEPIVVNLGDIATVRIKRPGYNNMISITLKNGQKIGFWMTKNLNTPYKLQRQSENVQLLLEKLQSVSTQDGVL